VVHELAFAAAILAGNRKQSRGITAGSDRPTLSSRSSTRERWQNMAQINRRELIEGAAGVVGGIAFGTSAGDAARAAAHQTGSVDVALTVNGEERRISVEPRTTLLDALRGQLSLTGTKKGCDRGECGACTVHIEGRRVLSCMTLAAMQGGRRITTIEGLAQDGKLHAVQEAFIEHDGFQCGFCTSGQIMSAVAMIKEANSDWPSAATPDVSRPFMAADLSELEIRERMSGNLCRCACYPNIVDAIASAARRT
jgi:xanthine dehydrogenase YagT iron-sulfur-binding subunit